MKNKIIKIPAKRGLYIENKYKRKVAVYARVSTDQNEQIHSLEAQKEYYTNLINSRSGWELVGIFADEGISGLSRQNRETFNNMIAKADEGQFNLIITKSISRFARNTVDTLQNIRHLKSIGCEVWFEKEDIWTFDSKGEFMLTLLSSMAQEESRSISENTVWGLRKRFADGKYSVAYSHFLGYEHNFVINEDEAGIVRKIYLLFLSGNSKNSIAGQLENEKVLTPEGKTHWQQAVVSNILSNEKYKGDALLQKSFTIDFLTKKVKKNEGELNQYYVHEGHPPIIPPKTFDYVQSQLNRINGYKANTVLITRRRIVCGKCGGFCRVSSGHGDHYVSCHNGQCKMPYIRYEEIGKACISATRNLLRQYNHLLIKQIMQYSESIITAAKNRTKKSMRTQIGNFINDLTGGKEFILDESVFFIISDSLILNEDRTITFEFIDGSVITIAI